MSLQHIIIIHYPQAKYYARIYGTVNSERKGTDKLIVSYNPRFSNEYSIIEIEPFILFFTMNLAISIVGIYFIPEILRRSVSYCEKNSNSLTTKEFSELYWATVMICAVINSVCTICTYAKCEPNCFFQLAALLPIYFISFVIEVVSIWVSIKDFKITKHSVFCFSDPSMVRIIHTLAICHILWFIHRVGCSLLVAVFFIALAPAQTLAAISLVYFVIFWTIIYMTFNIHYIRKVKCCKKSSCGLICKLFVMFVLYLLVAIFLITLTLLFNELGNNGLTSSGLGSVVLSLVAPTIVFIITLKLKKHLETYFTIDSIPSIEDGREINPFP